MPTASVPNSLTRSDWPIVLFAGGSLAGGLLFGLLDAKIGQLGMSMLAFVGWPASAVWAYLIIHDIQP